MHMLKEFLEFLQRDKKKIICFGTSLMAEEAMGYLQIREAVSCFIDNDILKQGKVIKILDQEYPVWSPENIMNQLDSKTIILLASSHYKSMERQLWELGLPQYVEVYAYPVLKVNSLAEGEEFFKQRILNECIKEYEIVLKQYHLGQEEYHRKLEEKKRYIMGENEKERPLVLPRVMVMPTTRCNLRCKGCSSLLPLFEKPEDVPIKQIIDDFEIFFSGIDECIRITVGGEPFLYPHLEEILHYLLEQEKVLGIMLITNSTILPKEEIIKLLSEPKILIEVSDYGDLERMSRLIHVLEDNAVNFDVLTEQTWTDMGGVECRNRGKEELRFQYLNCDQGRVIKGIYNGKFYTCARSARMAALGAYSAENDCFELREEDKGSKVKTKILEMYYKEMADACNYCDLGTFPTKVIEAGVQMGGYRKKSEYTIVNRQEYELLKRLSQIKD